MTSARRQSRRTAVRRHPERGAYDRDLIDAILDEGFICHVGYAAEHGLVVLPTLYGRESDALYLHGSPAAGMFRHADPGVDVCVTVTLVDGLVLARSLFHHSMNYRSVVIFGRAEEVRDPEEVQIALRAITENVLPGRWDEARRPNETELSQTHVVKVPLTEVSAKCRTGPPKDDVEDLELDVWAGVVPIKTRFGKPIVVSGLSSGIGLPGGVR